MKNKGFTLIELLVVIAIIGILSSVVLASLNTARNKGEDAAVKSNLAGARAEAEIYYDTASTYEGVCAASGSNVIGDSVNAAAVATGATFTAGDATVPSATVAATTLWLVGRLKRRLIPAPRFALTVPARLKRPLHS